MPLMHQHRSERELQIPLPQQMVETIYTNLTYKNNKFTFRLEK